jgi:hypothetical protein
MGTRYSSSAFIREAGIGRIHLCQTRHTFARMVAKCSWSLSETQDARGHLYDESITVKADKYSQHILETL